MDFSETNFTDDEAEYLTDILWHVYALRSEHGQPDEILYDLIQALEGADVISIG